MSDWWKDSSREVKILVASLLVFVGLFFYFELSTSGEKDITDIEYPENYPEVYAGTEEGNIYHVEPGQKPTLEASVGKPVHRIEFAEDKAIVSAGIEGNGKSNKVVIFNGTERIVNEFDGFVYGATLSDGKLFVANHGAKHSHSSTEDSEEELEEHTHQGSGSHIGVYDADTGTKLKEYPLEGSYRIDQRNDLIIALGGEGGVLLIDKDSLKLEERINTGEWAGGLGFDKEGLLIGSRKQVISQINENLEPATVRKGVLGRYSWNGTLEKEMRLGISSVPHDIETYNNKILFTDMAKGRVIFADKNLENITDQITIGKSFTSKQHIPMEISISENSGYLADPDNGTIYNLNLDQKKVAGTIELPGLKTIKEVDNGSFAWD